MPFEELKKELAGKYLVTVRYIHDPALSSVYLFDAENEDRVKKILAEERKYVEKKQKGHSLPRLFKKHGISFDSVTIHHDTIIVWDKPGDEEEVVEVEAPKRKKKGGDSMTRAAIVEEELIKKKKQGWDRWIMEAMEDKERKEIMRKYVEGAFKVPTPERFRRKRRRRVA